MKAIALFLALAVTLSANPKAAALRARLPFTAHILDTRSMEPELRAGDLITVMAAPYSSLRIGSRVVRMDAWRRYSVPHVIVRNEGTPTMPRWVTQGINNKRPDPGWLLEDNYVGVWEKLPKR